MEEKQYPLIEQEFCAKLDEYETMLKKGNHFSSQDYEIVKNIFSALVKIEAYRGMTETGDYDNPDDMDMNGMSGRRGRAANGRYVSRDGGNSYTEGYTQGYSEAMSQMNGNSGHYPPMPYYPTRRY